MTAEIRSTTGFDRRTPFRWASVLFVSASLVLLGPTSFPRDVDSECPGPDLMRDEDGDCMFRGELIVTIDDSAGGPTRTDLERAIAPYSGRLDRRAEVIGVYAVTFPGADTVAELGDIEAALERLGFRVSRSIPGQLFT